ncbi:MAG: hypothetical protein HOO94_11880 [Novosphingobium sp.]|nr:hypothetical protein [Novosphingobium sp.]
MRALSALALVTLSSLALAKPPSQPIESGEIRSRLPAGATIETRLDADITGDGLRDIVVVGRGEDERRLVVLVGYSSDTDMGYRPVGEMAMDISPLGSVELSLKAGVLIVEDLTDGTTAISSLYRFRYDKPADRMRLIGDDVTLYSRTCTHGSVEISTNRLTGVQVTTRSELRCKGGNVRLVEAKPVTNRVSRKPVYIEEAPDPAETLGWGD